MTNPIRVEYGFAPLIAALCAGPIFCTTLMAAIGFSSLPNAIPIEPEAPLVALLMLLPATVVGTLLAILPCMTGCALMAHLGRAVGFSPEAPYWAAAGAFPVGIGILISGPEPDAAPAHFAFLATGTACALICRHFTRWSEAPDRTPAPPARPTVNSQLGDADPRLLR